MEEVMMSKKEWMDTHTLTSEELSPFKECVMLECSICPFATEITLKTKTKIRLSGDCNKKVREYIELKKKVAVWKELR
jgi:hypothetical protein